MLHMRRKSFGGPLALVVSMVVVAALALTSGATSSAGPATRAASAPVAERVVAASPQGEIDSRIRGTTGNGRKVTGAFVPLKFTKRDGKVFVRGLLQGVVHNDDGSRKTFGVLRTLRVKTINGVPATRSGAARTSSRASCDVLNLVLGPLDLDLLGLNVNLDRVVLDIVAESGAGKLLGNLLCAVVGLLDGGLQGLLGRLTDLLNQILGRLGLGL
jgi:hypothetical protein